LPEGTPGDPQSRSLGWMGDDQRPTLTVTSPEAGKNPPLTRLLIGMADAYTGLDMTSFRVVADFPMDDVAAGQNLAEKFKPTAAGVWEWKFATLVADIPKGKLTVTIKDRQGNVSRIERTFSVSRKAPSEPRP
jgi:hypothetical protein